MYSTQTKVYVLVIFCAYWLHIQPRLVCSFSVKPVGVYWLLIQHSMFDVLYTGFCIAHTLLCNVMLFVVLYFLSFVLVFVIIMYKLVISCICILVFVLLIL